MAVPPAVAGEAVGQDRHEPIMAAEDAEAAARVLADKADHVPDLLGSVRGLQAQREALHGASAIAPRM